MIATGLIAFFGVVVFAAASFFFALAESALFSLGAYRIKQLAQSHSRRGEMVARLLQASPDLLATLVLGNVVANAAIVAIGLELVLRWQWDLWLTLPPLLIVVLIVGEVIPKTLAVRAPERWSLQVAPSLMIFLKLTHPFRLVAHQVIEPAMKWMVPSSWKPKTGMSDEEYQELLDLAMHQGTLARSEREIIANIINLDRRTARDVMKPRTQMPAIPDDLSIEEMVEAARQLKQRRLPVYDETPDTIVGILNTRKFLLDPHIDLSEVIEFPSFVPETTNLLQLLKSLQRHRRGLAIVLDEYGGTAGMVTLEDLLEEVVGEMKETDSASAFKFEKVSEGKWRVNGTMRIDDFQHEAPGIGEVPGVDTMGGLLVHQLECVPTTGQHAVFRGLKLTAHVVDDRRVLELLVETIKKK